jgi:dTDP-4-dehydrorhamnose 3,5-epimerase
MHYQKAPHEETKFVRCVRGALFDVIIDLRPDSPTYLKWAGFEISAASYQAVYVPAGCAHGVQTLVDDTEMLYMVSACYQPGAEGGIRWDDPLFNIQWPDVGQRIVSEKDLSWPDFQPSSTLCEKP